MDFHFRLSYLWDNNDKLWQIFRVSVWDNCQSLYGNINYKFSKLWGIFWESVQILPLLVPQRWLLCLKTVWIRSLALSWVPVFTESK